MKKHFELYPAQKRAEVFTIPSLKMIKTLKDCLQMETNFPARPYGPIDISGSFFGLYKRGLLDVHVNGKKSGSWYITTKGFHFLLSTKPVDSAA